MPYGLKWTRTLLEQWLMAGLGLVMTGFGFAIDVLPWVHDRVVIARIRVS